jgi:endonuclease/exonuclease/phosphatase family metal-dependent hydrolase
MYKEKKQMAIYFLLKTYMNGYNINWFSMKKMISWLFIIVAFSPALAQTSINVMSFNIRYNTSRDSANAWPNRRDLVASQLLFHEAQIIGVQEALHDQMMDLMERLPGFRFVGVGRDDGREKGEYSAIFYDSTRLQLLSNKTFWLSPEPDVPGVKGWDAANTRIVTWAKFRDRKSKKDFYMFNTHFDHIGKQARKESAKMLIESVNKIAGKSPVIITGDFNSIPSDEPIRIITDSENPLRLIDSRAISKSPHYGPTGTFNGFGPKETSNDPIDYVFVRNNVKVLKHATFSQTWQGRFSSDHFPMFVQVLIQ